MATACKSSVHAWRFCVNSCNLAVSLTRIASQPGHAPSGKGHQSGKRKAGQLNGQMHTNRIHKCPRCHAREGRDHL